MKKKKRLLLVLLVLALLIGGLGYWQRNNIEALLLSRKMTQEELADKITEHQEKTVEISRQAGVDVRALTEEEREAMHNSEISREELIDRIAGTQSLSPTEPSAPDAPAPEAPAQDPNAALREQLSRLVAEIYVMEAEYTGWLEKANQAAIDDFNALPEAERTTSNKFNIGMKYLSLAKDKEAEADAKMAELEGNIRSVLQQLGEPTTMVDEIHSTYLAEKAAKKAYYLGLH